MARVVFMGSKASGLAILRRVQELTCAPHQLIGVLCPGDAKDPRSELPAFRALASDCDLPLTVVRSAVQAASRLREWQPDVAIVLGWYWLIQVDHFPSTQFFGFHYSPLPRYRGNAPVVWQIIQGEQQVGLSLFRFGPGIDDGDLVAQARLPLAQDDTIGNALDRLEAAAVEIINDQLQRILDGTVEFRPQDHAKATYCGLRVPQDGRIDWTWSATSIHNFVRAQTRPYPGAFSTLPDGRQVRIWRTALDPRPYFGVPGGIAERSKGMVVITCGEGAIRVLEAQIDGEPPSPVGTIFTSLRLRMA